MLVRLKNGIDEAAQAEQIDDDGEGCCWLGKHGESLRDWVYLGHDEHWEQLDILHFVQRAMITS